MPEKTISIVMPIYNEEALLGELFARVTGVMDKLRLDMNVGAQWIVVNDGSRDRTLELLRGFAARDERLAVLNLSRNFGHQPAIQAGLEYATGDAVIIMDGDLQDPPELIPQLVNSWLAGNIIVVAQRRSRPER